MARRTGHGAEAPGANSSRDIRSFFSMKAQSALAASEASGQHDNGIPVSPSQSSGSALPDGGALVSTQARGSKAQRQPAHKSKRPAMTQDENRSPTTEGSNDTSASGTSPPRHAPASSGNLNTSTSLSELHTTPTLPPSAMRSILRTPGRQGSSTRICNENSADPIIPPSGSATGSPWKGVRWNSEPEVSTPKRNLWPSGKKTKTDSSCESAASLLPDSASLKSGLTLGTPKRDGMEMSISNGTPGSQLSLPELRSSPSIPSSPSSTKKRPALARDAVIKGSDYEDSDDSLSDCSLPDLDMLLPTKSRTDMCGTPKAKRRARIVHKSPLTIQPKHKFDFKTLDAHSKRHDVLFDSPKRAKGANVKDELMGDMEASLSKARQKLIEIAGVKAEEDADKALKAMERTDNSGSRIRWYFFTKGAVTGEDAVAFPKTRATGPWSFLEKVGTRDQHIMSGMPTRLAASVGLPDELYFWALDMVNTEKASVLREEYCRLAAANKPQVKRLITPQKLEEVFRKLGAADYVGDETLKPARQVRDIYVGRDWAALRSYLNWLHNIGRHLEYDTTVYAVKMLLRMAADSMILENPDVLMGHQSALAALVNNVEDDTWSEFCTEICSSLYHGFDKSSLRILPLACMPVASPKLHELRRRLAIAFFLRDAALAREHPDDAMSLRLVIARVKDSDFQINRKTDFADLRAQVQLLDMAVDDGSFVADKDDREHEKSFNAEIDDLSRRLKAIWRGINDTGAANLARTEAKSVLEWVGQRLTYAVRTKPPPTQSIFGEQGPSSVKKRRQQDFMQKFVHARKFKQAQSETKEEASSGEDDTFVTAYG